jgi:hypothetical protein
LSTRRPRRPREEDVVDWRPLLALLPRLTNVTLQRSPWTLGGSGLTGWLYNDPVLEALNDVVYESGIVFEFDWPSWKLESRFATTDPAVIAAAGLTDLRRLLTLHVRQDRFCDGHLGEMVEQGHIAVIVRRVAELVAQPSG